MAGNEGGGNNSARTASVAIPRGGDLSRPLSPRKCLPASRMNHGPHAERSSARLAIFKRARWYSTWGTVVPAPAAMSLASSTLKARKRRTSTSPGVRLDRGSSVPDLNRRNSCECSSLSLASSAPWCSASLLNSEECSAFTDASSVACRYSAAPAAFNAPNEGSFAVSHANSFFTGDHRPGDTQIVRFP